MPRTTSNQKAAESIRAARKAKGMSQTALADLVGLTIGELRKYESGQANMSLSMLDAIGDALGVPISISFQDSPDASESGPVVKVPARIKNKMLAAFKHYKAGAECMEVVEQWLEDNNIDPEIIRTSDGCGLEEIEYAEGGIENAEKLIEDICRKIEEASTRAGF